METKEIVEQILSLKKELSEEAKGTVAKGIADIEEKLKGKVNSDELKAFQAKLDEYKSLNETVVKITDELKEAKDAATKNQQALDEMLVKANRVSNPEPISLKSAIAEAFTDEEFVRNIESYATNKKSRERSFGIDLKAGTTLSASSINTAYWGNVNAGTIVANPSRRTHIRNLLNVGTIGAGTSFSYMREKATTSGLSARAELSDANQFTLNLEEATVQVEAISGYMKVTRKAMANIPGFMAWLQSRIPELYLRAEDYYLVNGTGNTPVIAGFFKNGNCLVSNSAESYLLDRITDDLAQLEENDEVNATGILLRPANYYAIYKQKASGSGEYNTPQNLMITPNGQLLMSGVPIYASTAMNVGQYAVADFNMGANLLVQNPLRIEFFDQDGDNVKSNLITIRVESTLAFPINGSRYFLRGDVPGQS